MTAEVKVRTNTPTVTATILWTLLGFMLFCIPLIWLYPRTSPEDLVAKRASERLEIKKTVVAKQDVLTQQYGWIDKEAGIAHVPNEVVINQVIEELSKKPVGPSSMTVDPAAAVVDGGTTLPPAPTSPSTPATPGGKP